MMFPNTRLRRLRSTRGLRSLVREHTLTVDDLIYPVFVVEGNGIKEEIASMPGVYHYSLDTFEQELAEITALGISALMLFGVPGHKDEQGSGSRGEDGIVQRAIRLIKASAPNLVVMADTCLCQFTDHGHCGVISGNGREAVIDNDASLKLLTETAISQASAGADVIAPSNMMDGFVQAIRSGLDQSGYTNIPIMSYAVKYASAFYGPFREAAHSTPQFGDRSTYQMDPANVREALREAEQDVMEGADILMVKPAMAYLDVVREIRQQFDSPIAAYNVSGEYAMIKAAAANGWVDEQSVVMELLTGMKRAGADMILTYFAKDAARWLS